MKPRGRWVNKMFFTSLSQLTHQDCSAALCPCSTLQREIERGVGAGARQKQHGRRQEEEQEEEEEQKKQLKHSSNAKKRQKLEADVLNLTQGSHFGCWANYTLKEQQQQSEDVSFIPSLSMSSTTSLTRRMTVTMEAAANRCRRGEEKSREKRRDAFNVPLLDHCKSYSAIQCTWQKRKQWSDQTFKLIISPHRTQHPSNSPNPTDNHHVVKVTCDP